MKTAAEFRREYHAALALLKDVYGCTAMELDGDAKVVHDDFEAALDTLAARESQVKRLVEAGRALLAIVDEGILVKYPPLGISNYRRSECIDDAKEVDALEAAIAAVESEEAKHG